MLSAFDLRNFKDELIQLEDFVSAPALRSKMAKQLFLEHAARLDKQAAIDGLV